MPKKIGFVAPKRLSKSLQKVLIDLVALHNVGKQAHWNIVGPNFRDLHLNLDELVMLARKNADEVAERMRALHAVPDGRPKTVADGATLPDFPAGKIHTHDAMREIVASIDQCVATIRSVFEDVDSDDPASADLLTGFILGLEQQSWFIGAELREPESATSTKNSKK